MTARTFDPTKLNLTELVALASQVNPDAHRGLPREALEMITLGAEVELPKRTIDKKRLQIMQHINERWIALSYQVSCPAKTRSPDACSNCTDLQAASCAIENRKLFMQDD